MHFPDEFRPCISTMSLGYAHCGHSLLERLDLIAKMGIYGIELYEADLWTMALTFPRSKSEAGASTTSTSTSTLPLPSVSQLVCAAREISKACKKHGLHIVCLQPFRHFEGLVNRAAFAMHLEELDVWCTLCHILGTDLILFPSSFLPAAHITADMDVIVGDFQTAADLAGRMTPPVRLCYEALAWGTAVSTWQQSWDVVVRVNRPNFGLCLDTFNMLGRTYADPAAPGGCVDDAHARAIASIAELRDTVDVERVFLLQVADGQRLDQPIVQGHELYESGTPERLLWSRNHRLFYGESERGGYLPVKQLLDVIFFDLGYRGWVSHEIFNHRMSDTDKGVPYEMASRAKVSWGRMVHDLKLPVSICGADASVQTDNDSLAVSVPAMAPVLLASAADV